MSLARTHVVASIAMAAPLYNLIYCMEVNIHHTLINSQKLITIQE